MSARCPREMRFAIVERGREDAEVVLEEVAVDVERERGGWVSELSLHDLDASAGRDGERRGRVADRGRAESGERASPQPPRARRAVRDRDERVGPCS
jgi:hypothetical protein